MAAEAAVVVAASPITLSFFSSSVSYMPEYVDGDEAMLASSRREIKAATTKTPALITLLLSGRSSKSRSSPSSTRSKTNSLAPFSSIGRIPSSIAILPLYLACSV